MIEETKAIFLSYASQDAEIALRIADALRAAGFDVWFDQTELRGGDAWDVLIRKRIKDCMLFVPVISKNTESRREGYFRLEWKLAVDRSHLMADDQAFIMPVVIDDTSEAQARVPDRFRERQWSRLSGDAAFAAFAKRVGQAIPQLGNGDARPASPDQPKPASALKAIAVLPLANMSADPENEYFSDGMTEEIINALSKVPGVHVASRSSCFAFKGKKDVNVRQIGEKLGVTTLLEGSVRKVGNRIRIAAQLVNVDNGYQLWSETYDRQLEDIFALQDEISRSIVDALKLQLVGAGAAVVAPTKSLDAYTTYLKGRFHFNKFSEISLRKANDLFQNALLQDPGFARAYAGIADVWCDLADDWVAPDDAYPRAKSAAERALQRDPELADAMISIGKVLSWHEWKFAEAVRYVERAVMLSPNNAEAHWVLGTALPLVGRLQDGIAAMRRALELDPLRVEYFGWAARMILYARDYKGAIAQGMETFEIDEAYGRGFVFVGSAYLAMGDAEQALDWFQRGQSLDKAVRSYDAMIVRALAALGRREEAEEILARLESESRQHYVRAEYLAMGHAALGDLDGAFGALDRAYQARSAGLIYLHLDPGYDPLRGDPRYKELVQRIGLR
jgi:TolB-like protein/Tfp pilus assembly protein PilF